MRYPVLYNVIFIALLSCDQPGNMQVVSNKEKDTVQVINDSIQEVIAVEPGQTVHISTGKTTPAELITFARTLTGVPYLEASADPTKGFDCSGFITYVFNHFNIGVPRRSVDFTYVDHEIALTEAKAGDLVLFTGTDSLIRIVGHMGIVVSAYGEPLKFIHSTSGKAYGVTETSLEPYYVPRFVKVVRVFPQNKL